MADNRFLNLNTILKIRRNKMPGKNLELKRYVESQEYQYPINLSEDGTKILVTTYMPPGKTIDEFHDLCDRIGFGIDRKSGYLFDGESRQGHEKQWEAYLYGLISGPHCPNISAIAGFNPNLGVVEVSWNGAIDYILEIFDIIEDGELISPQKLKELSKK